MISTQLQEEDYKIESSLRPQRLEDYIGQEKVKENFKDFLLRQPKVEENL